MMTNPRTRHGFGMVSNDVMRNPEITLQEKALYAYLSTYADGTTNELFVSVNKIATECNMGVSSVKRHLESLVKKGVISRIFRGYGTSRITILNK